MRTWLAIGATIAILLALLPVLLITKARNTTSPNPRVHIIVDMDQQAKYKPQQYSPLFADRRAMRPPVSGTVARGQLRLDDHLYRGRVDGEWVDTFPFPITDLIVKRGQEKYEVACALCHGYAGYGDGMIGQRAELRQEPLWVPPTSFHEEQIRERELGHLFNTITHGIRNMPAMGDKITPEDRWAIIAYVRALQRSQNAEWNDITPEIRAEYPRIDVESVLPEDALNDEQDDEQNDEPDDQPDDQPGNEGE
jgi:mono/diheme cytochrome c family protein